MTHEHPRRALTEDQQGRLLRAAERRGVRDHALVALALTAGLREGELARLDDADVSITARTGHVWVAAGKASEPRVVPLPAQTRSAITAWREHRGQASRGLRDPALFVARDGQRLSARSVDRVIRDAGRAAGSRSRPEPCAVPSPATWSAPAVTRSWLLGCSGMPRLTRPGSTPCQPTATSYLGLIAGQHGEWQPVAAVRCLVV